MSLASSLANDHPWVIFNAVIAFLALIAYGVHEVARPMLHKHKLRTQAVDWCFNILARKKFELKYAPQSEDDEHHTMDIVLPAHEDDLYIELLMKPRSQLSDNIFPHGNRP